MNFLKKKFSVGIFGMNASSGISMVNIPQRWDQKWDNIKFVAKFLDKNNFDFILPIARWKGYGGSTNPTGNCYETLSFSGCLSGITKKIFLFATVHVPFIHPVYASRCLSTIDHSSNGRVGLNIVCGWSKDEFDMFGEFNYDKDKRYIHGEEWVKIMKSLFKKKTPLNFSSEFFKINGGICEPKPIQKPHPPIMSAAFSPDGRKFALENCNILFTTFSDTKRSKLINLEILKKKPNIKIFTAINIFCKKSRVEAEEYFDYCTNKKSDKKAVNNFIKNLGASSPIVSKYLKKMKQTVAAGAGTFSFVGSPKDITEQIRELYDAKFSGIAVSMVNYRSELKIFSEKILPNIRNF